MVFIKGFIPWNKGKTHSLKTKEKLRQIALDQYAKGKVSWNKGKKLPQFSGKNHWLYGKHQSEEVKRKISESRKGKGKWSDERREKDRLTRKRGKESKGWKGGRFIIEGYVYVYAPNHPKKTLGRYVREHRLVMEKKLGRYLEDWEVVHHINGIKNDNRLENLQLIPSLGEHNTQMQKLFQENKRLKEENEKLKGGS